MEHVIHRLMLCHTGRPFFRGKNMPQVTVPDGWAPFQVAYLIVDPHYTGKDELKPILTKGWVGWKMLGLHGIDTFTFSPDFVKIPCDFWKFGENTW